MISILTGNIGRRARQTRRILAALSAAAGFLIASAPACQAQTATSTTRVSAVELQVALDRHGFGVGFIDNREGRKTKAALEDFKASGGITNDAAVQASLGIGRTPAFRNYTIEQADFDVIGEAPAEWVEASEVETMAYESLQEVISEKFHVAPDYLARLNPDIDDWDTTNLVGQVIKVPNVLLRETPAQAAELIIDSRRLRIRAIGTNGNIIASFPCSMAMAGKTIPSGELRVTACAKDPTYTFDPKNYPESPRARAVGRKLIIPPGPNNPVGVFWIGLNLPGFGIHGTPHPETIGARESHGCFRLTNWDIIRLSRMVSSGTPVTVTGLEETTSGSTGTE